MYWSKDDLLKGNFSQGKSCWFLKFWKGYLVLKNWSHKPFPTIRDPSLHLLKYVNETIIRMISKSYLTTCFKLLHIVDAAVRIFITSATVLIALLYSQFLQLLPSFKDLIFMKFVSCMCLVQKEYITWTTSPLSCHERSSMNETI